MSGALRAFTIGLTAFLTVVDLFATQAILPSLTRAYGVTPAAMGFAANTSTIGMAVGSLAVALFGRAIDRRRGIVLSLAILSLPTLLLATMPPLPIFAGLRIVQGLCMSTAFALTLAYLGENTSAADTASAFAAYITGNVASNLLGRLLAAGLVDRLGLSTNFCVFATLNLCGAALVWFTVKRTKPKRQTEANHGSPLASFLVHLENPALLATFAIGFLILFAFIGTFTYVNFVLVGPPFGVSMMMLGVVYFVFLPSMITTPLAGRIVARFGTRPTLWASFALAAAGLPLLLGSNLPGLLLGLVLVAVGTFFAQATATGFVGRAATRDRDSASGLYLASYYLGGLTGSAVLGQAFDRLDWTACVIGIGAALALGAALATRLIAQDHRPDAETAFQPTGALLQGEETR
jgi:MFS transporter, YNFM family, putative membrane transport protein